jgi:hypothetical protein
MSFVPPVRVRASGSGFKAPIVKSQQANPEATKNPDSSDKISPAKIDPDNSIRKNVVPMSGLSQGTLTIPKLHFLYF